MEVTPRGEAEAVRAGVLSVETKLTGASPSRFLVDPLPVLCDASSCQQERDGILLYGDDNHLSDVGAARVSDAVVDQIRAALVRRAR